MSDEQLGRPVQSTDALQMIFKGCEGDCILKLVRIFLWVGSWAFFFKKFTKVQHGLLREANIIFSDIEFRTHGCFRQWKILTYSSKFSKMQFFSPQDNGNYVHSRENSYFHATVNDEFSLEFYIFSQIVLNNY